MANFGVEEGQKALGWAARDSSGVLSPLHFIRRPTGDQDVTFKVMYCGICHSDIHFVKNDWENASYPAIPGMSHSRLSIRKLTRDIGNKVQNFKVGDKVGVGCLVGSCRSCEDCANDLENYCPEHKGTFGSTYYDGTKTLGGYSDIFVVDEHFAVHIPEGMPLDATAPLLCAGITVYSPLKYYGLDKPGLHIGVVGLGGVGHMAVKFVKAFGAKVTVISTSPSKKDEAINRLGADYFLISREPEQMQAAKGTMDGIIDTVSVSHAVVPLLSLLKSHGKLIVVGAPKEPFELSAFPLLGGRKMVAGSCIGGMKETQEMLDFAAKNNILSDVEVIPMDYVNTAWERVLKADVRYRFVIDIANTLKST